MAVQTLPEPLCHIAPSTATPGYFVPERRRHVRSRIAGLRAAVVNIDAKNAALVINLGEGGMGVRALGRPLQEGAALQLQFQLPGSPEPIQASGVVAWVNDTAEAGIRFGELSESLACRLREWIAKNDVVNAAREFLRVAGGWQAALDLVADLIRILTGPRGVAITMAGSEKNLISSSPKQESSPPLKGGQAPQPTPALLGAPSLRGATGLPSGFRPIAHAFPDPEAQRSEAASRPQETAQDPPIRATVAAPIYEGERIIGHLEISSTELGAFDEQDLRALSVLAGLVSEMAHLRAAEPPETAHKPPLPLSSRIASRIEAMFPKTIRVRLVP